MVQKIFFRKKYFSPQEIYFSPQEVNFPARNIFFPQEIFNQVTRKPQFPDLTHILKDLLSRFDCYHDLIVICRCYMMSLTRMNIGSDIVTTDKPLPEALWKWSYNQMALQNYMTFC